MGKPSPQAPSHSSPVVEPNKAPRPPWAGRAGGLRICSPGTGRPGGEARSCQEAKHVLIHGTVGMWLLNTFWLAYFLGSRCQFSGDLRLADVAWGNLPLTRRRLSDEETVFSECSQGQQAGMLAPWQSGACVPVLMFVCLRETIQEKHHGQHRICTSKKLYRLCV